ncbi:Carboxylesterase 1 [Camellia lanceoleosa]|uniref:Carboxylesterase 1 n=1 Tax=Camellia lanceoleosa TaxID=1840588 RepID=A0ACC0J3P8_9ERIC|nr:Carboxylesterase 1 [Camellia lanceoleosa]
MPSHPSSLSSDPTSVGQAFDCVSIIRNPDGTITRVQQFPSITATPDPNSSTCPVLSKDVSLNPHHNTWVRIFLPAGGNIAYHAALRAAAAAASADLEPLKIKGLILHHPCFGGSHRTKSQMRLVNERIIPLFMNDLTWECSLPIGADRDHKYSNPTVSNEPVERVRLLGWKVMVTGCEGDPLIDRQMEVAKMLKEKGVQVMAQFNAGGCHTVEFLDPTKAKAYHVILKQFVYPSASRL